MPAAVIPASRRATSRSSPEPAVEAAAASGLGVPIDAVATWGGIAGAPRVGLARRTGRAPKRESWARSRSAGASAPAVLSTLARTPVASGVLTAGDARPPIGTGPVEEGTASMYWAIAAVDGTDGGGAPAIAGDASTTAAPAEQVAAISIRIDAIRLASGGRGERRPAGASPAPLGWCAHALGRWRVLRPRLQERELRHDDLGGGGGARVVDPGTRRGRRSPRTTTTRDRTDDGNAACAPRRLGAPL